MNDLLAGTGGARITPPIGCPMGGYGARDHGAEGVHDHLNTHALFLDDGSTQAVIIANDLLGMRAEQVARVRELVHAATGVPAAHVFLAFSHTHGGPLMYSDFSALEEQVATYIDAVSYYMAGAALQAATSAVPVRWGTGRHPLQVGVNRRERQADGTTRIGVNPDGVVAPWVDAVWFEREDGGPLSVIYQHAAHGTCLVRRQLPVHSRLDRPCHAVDRGPTVGRDGAVRQRLCWQYQPPSARLLCPCRAPRYQGW